MEYDNTNTGVLFKNESENEKAPAYKGKIDVNGTEYQLAAWIRTGKSGQKFMSLKIEAPRSAPKPKQETFEDLPDDLPF